MKGMWSHSRKLRAPEVIMAILNDSTQVGPWGAVMYTCMMVARRTLRRSPQRIARMFRDIRLAEKTEIPGIQGPAHTFHYLLDALGLDLKAINGAWVLIDEHGAKVDFLQASKQHFKKTITMWVRKAIMQQLHDRAKLPDGYEEGQDKPKGYRKDMDGVPPNVDLNATTANYRQKKGRHPYATDKHLKNT